MAAVTEGRKRKPYKKISDSPRAQIGRYALENGNAAELSKYLYRYGSLVLHY